LTHDRRTQQRDSANRRISGHDYNHDPGGKISPAEVDHVARMLIVVHSLALASIPVVFLGAWGMSRWLGGTDRLAWAGLVLYGLASVAVMNAAVCDGLLAPNLMKHIVSATPETRDGWQMMMNYNFQMNQAFARVYAVGASLAVVFWSLSTLRNRTLGLGVGIYGIVLGVVTAAGIVSGLLTPDRHGFGMLIFGQAIWFLLMAGKMWRSTVEIAGRKVAEQGRA
jgi:hypothetical protein